VNREQRNRLAGFVNEWMDERGLSERAAADILDVSQTAISSWKNARTSMKLDSFIEFARVIGRTPEWLLAQVRGVPLESLPRQASYQDVRLLVDGLSEREKRNLLTHLVSQARWDNGSKAEV